MASSARDDTEFCWLHVYHHRQLVCRASSQSSISENQPSRAGSKSVLISPWLVEYSQPLVMLTNSTEHHTVWELDPKTPFVALDLPVLKSILGHFQSNTKPPFLPLFPMKIPWRSISYQGCSTSVLQNKWLMKRHWTASTSRSSTTWQTNWLVQQSLTSVSSSVVEAGSFNKKALPLVCL